MELGKYSQQIADLVQQMLNDDIAPNMIASILIGSSMSIFQILYEKDWAEKYIDLVENCHQIICKGKK